MNTFSYATLLIGITVSIVFFLLTQGFFHSDAFADNNGEIDKIKYQIFVALLYWTIVLTLKQLGIGLKH